MTANIYRQIAPYYDLLHARLTQDIGFSLSLAARNPGPTLELGCGTGRLLLPLARAGHPVLGLDTSIPMLARARQALGAEPPHVRRKASLIVADMTSFALAPAHFALTLVGYNTWMLPPLSMRCAPSRAISSPAVASSSISPTPSPSSRRRPIRCFP
jgi:SAM-dependent methyltransferase